VDATDPSYLVSIVIPAYRRPAYLRECLDSVLAQTYRGIVVYVGVERGDADVRAVGERYAARDPRVRVASLDPSPLGSKLNVLLSMATGAAVGIFSDDDVMEPAFVERCAQILRGGPFGYAFSDFYRWDAESDERIPSHPLADGVCPLNLNAALFDLRALDAVRRKYGDCFDPALRVYADTILLHRLRTLGYSAAHVHEALIRYRVHRGQMSRRVTFPLVLDYIAAARQRGEMDLVRTRDVLRLLGWMAANRTGLTRRRVLGRQSER
jgi:glycosyltransferase involved in cell wall biosynthesis